MNSISLYFLIFIICFGLTLFISGVIISLIQGLLYFTLRKFNKKVYRKINYYLAYSFFSQLVFLTEWWAGSDILFYINKEVFEKYFGKEHAFIIANHCYEIDWIMGWLFCERMKVLGSSKGFVKKSFMYLPPLGWSWKFVECVFLERSFDKDKNTILKQIKDLCDYPDPMWLVMYPEGTRFSTEKQKASQKFSKENGLPLLKYHLTPRTKGFTTSLMGMRGKISAVYDMNFAFNKNDKIAPTLINMLLGQKVHVHIYVTRIPIDEIPEPEEEATKWLHNHYAIKDRIQESFHKTGDFFTKSGIEKIEPFKLPRRIYSLINVIFWSSVILPLVFQQIFCILLRGTFLHVSLLIIIFCLFYIFVKTYINIGNIHNSSLYGTEKKKAD